MVLLPVQETTVAIPLDNIAWMESEGQKTRVYLRHPVAAPPLYFTVDLPMGTVVDLIESERGRN